MNDFVDRLLGRIDAPPIRPLVPTLFEPASPVGAEPGLPMGTFTESERKPVVTKETERVREVPGLERIIQETLATLPGPVERVRETEVSHTERVEGGRETRVLGPESVERVRETSVQSPPVVERVREVSEPGEPGTVVRESVVESRTHTEHATVSSSERVTESLREHEVRTENLQRETVLQPVAAAEREVVPVPPEPERAAPVPAVDPVRAHPVARPRPEPGPQPQQQLRQPLAIRRQKAPVEPDVHISIGRVEVVARPAPAAAPKPPKERKPLLSLDDYLRERG
ncbi:hypothetical protein ACFXPA_10810 [Amycolatopsis sp. NPDC059090]|uniref:hypothetical protein n=1 Tax=unclassified Amycolatopsis TaxID=2618356 RepID=UPI003672B299